MRSAARQTLLLTNDDGINSPLLHAVVTALSARYALRVVAPAEEQSWIGKAISRRSVLRVERTELLGSPAWAVHGTPADCVNVALGSLLADQGIDAVVSGINIGFNASLATILSSGTVGAALEAALMGKPAIALSKSLPHEWFEGLQQDRGAVPPALQQSLEADGSRLSGFVTRAVEEFQRQPERVVVHNYNFPFDSHAGTEVWQTAVASTRAGGLFQPLEEGSGRFGFRYRLGENMDTRTKTDLNCLKEGHISYAPIDFTRITQFG